MTTILIFFILFFIIRLAFLAVSIKNEKNLIKNGAVQVGNQTSTLLAAAHIAYYFLALLNAYLVSAYFDVISFIGVVIVCISFMILAVIIKQLGEIWTVKIYIAPNHKINTSWLFKTFKHPNYFLNIIPELIGIAILCHAWWVLIIGLPIYGLILAKRIRQEEHAMQHLF
ncbi:isoprenylcysteine carboxyl methyltransferase, ICMT family protein [Moraxella macacae 0408225]|uniref:Isoprenylcysteine carboxyl methyltransferase, ICMT family protein n=1 Tax=Moraxella macacae 0408225 TaxID=1230338 RepID=L2F857_9GAMM|nr:isoprenylcysteine carboxyl methyltransferase family protein [Moraxella macacae]ELA08966.1 isoprenylcysteine carboxyl methyltransferase, ICMT family protein [Moraxella macacae 0408225]